MFSNKLNYRVINITAFLALLYIAVTNVGVWWGIFIKIASVMAPFIVAFVFAYAINPLIKWLEEKGIKRGFGVVIVLFAIIFIFGGLVAIMLPMIYDQLLLLVGMLGDVIQNIGTKFNVNLWNFEIKLTDYLNTAIGNIGNMISSTTMGFLSWSLSFVSNFIVGFVGFIYFMIDMPKIRNWFKEIFSSVGKRCLKYVKCLDIEITNYLKGLGIFMIIQLFEYSILFLIIGHPNWLILGILASITTIIPYFGGLITNIIAIIMASVVSTPVLIGTIIICLIFPQLDGYLISPKIYGKTNDVNPLITIMAVSVGGTLAGLIGIVIALPCYLFLRTTYNFYKKDLEKGIDKVKTKRV